MYDTITIHLVHTTCCHEGCGVTFGVEESHRDYLRKSHGTFYCPNGHPQSFTNKTKEEELAEKLRYAEQSRDYHKTKAEEFEASNQALRGVVTRTKKRIANGVCACCNRSFHNLAAHMKTKHPAYVKEANALPPPTKKPS